MIGTTEIQRLRQAYRMVRSDDSVETVVAFLLVLVVVVPLVIAYRREE